MRKYVSFTIENTEKFKQKIAFFLSKYQIFSILDSNDFSKINNKFTDYEYISAFDSLEIINEQENDNFEFLEQKHFALKDWLIGFLTYDLKNEIENLSSKNFDGIKAPKMLFFQPRFILIIQEKRVNIYYHTDYNTENETIEIFNQIQKQNTILQFFFSKKISINQRVNKKKYIESIKNLQKNIKLGDVYEANYCIEFYSENIDLEPISLYSKLKSLSPAPFSSFFRFFDTYIISASPERFLKKKGETIYSQPIKGTIRRGYTATEDLELKNILLYNPKERAENIMIVDLVRNDLSKTALFGTVNVDELCQIYSFAQVHQLISTVSCKVSEIEGFKTLKNCFPMGSMTGAPKIKAMQLIEKYEKTKRGIYSGSIGYIKPNGDYDFNVVIRTILFNSQQKYLSFMTGSAITHLSIPENEYDECQLKAKSLFDSILK